LSARKISVNMSTASSTFSNESSKNVLGFGFGFGFVKVAFQDFKIEGFNFQMM